jgi:hypothetical protein
MKHSIKKVGMASALFFMSKIALAAGGNDSPSPTSPINSVSDVQNWLVQATKWGFTFFFILAVAFILIAAYRFLMARDNKAEVDAATKSLKNAAIAIAIALVSAGVSSIISSALKI